MTENNSEAWWQVDLGSSYAISSVKIYNRTDCCDWRLVDFYILISDDPFTSYDLTTTLNQSGVTSEYVTIKPGSPTEYTFTSTTGRYVRIQLENSNYLTLTEVEVIGVPNGPVLTPTATVTPSNTTVPSITPTPTAEPLSGDPYNVSLGKTASQSSLQELAYASLAVDGNTDGDFANGSVAMTEINAEAWWEVDLGASYNISSVNIYNVSSCCNWYFDDFYILISDSPFTSYDLTTTLNQSGVASYYSDTRPNRPSEYTFTSTTGRYVRIQLSGSNHLQIAEVEVMGILVGTPTATSTPTATPTATTEATSSGMNAGSLKVACPLQQEEATNTPTPTDIATPTVTPTPDPQALPDDFSTASYTYDGDDNMVKSVIDGVTTYYVGGIYELIVEGTDETEVKYYYAASRRIAMRTVTDTTNTLHWLISDHLSSTTIITDESGTIVSEMKYTAFGEIREMNGSSPTDYLYTGQRKEVEFGLSYYVARWYDSSTGHFISADTLIPQPGDSGNWDRYAYVLNNPLKYIDPSGHYYSGPEANDFYQQTQYGGSYYDITSLYDRPDTEWQLAVIFIHSSNFYRPEYANGISLPDGPASNPTMPTIGLGGVGSIEAQTPLVAGGVDALATIANDVLNIVSLFHDDQSHNVFAYQVVELFGEDEFLEIVGILIVNYSKMEIEVMMNEPNGICGYVPRGEYVVFPTNGAGYSWDPPYKHGNLVDPVYTVDFILAGYAGDFPIPGETRYIVGPERFYREYFYNDYQSLINAYHNQ